MTIPASIPSLRASLNAAFLERRREIDGLLVALLAEEHVLLLGPPGTAKSALAQALADALEGSYFQRLLTPFSVPEELFGPFSLSALQADSYERKIDGYLPTADVAFLDEALALDTQIPTPSGWTPMGDLREGDEVLGSNGRPTVIRRVTETATNHSCYRVHFRDGTSIVADAGHNWASRPAKHRPGTPFRVRTTSQMANSGQSFQVPLPEPVVLPDAVLPVDPYALGIWLGNGNCWNGEVIIRAEWVEKTIAELSACGLEATDAGPSQGRDTVNIVRLTGTGFRTVLGDLGMFGEDRSTYTGSHKFVPAIYLRGSISQRQRLLQGLMDTDGWTDGSTCVFSNTNESLVDAVLEIVRSFGWPATKVTTNDKRIGANGPHKVCWKVTFRADPRLAPFLVRPVEIAPLAQERAMLIHSFEPVASVPVRCIEVDAPDHLFLAGPGFTVTHNCFKANSAILNALLTALNERAFDQGAHRISIPLKLCVGASNELPQDDVLAALYDRFSVRFWVEPVKSRDSRRALISMAGAPVAQVKVTADELQAARDAARAVVLPPAVVDALLDLHEALARECGTVISDRRLRKCVKLVQARAALDGRDVATLRDLEILADSLWQKPEDRAGIYGQILTVAAPNRAAAQAIVDAATEAISRLDLGNLTASNIGDAARVLKDLRAMAAEIRGLGDDVGDLADVVTGYVGEITRATAKALGA